jgi:hypothetical protein
LPYYDGWELDEQLRHIERVLQTVRGKRCEAEVSQRRGATRIDPAHAEGPRWHVPSVGKPVKQGKSGNRGAGLGVFMWLILVLGTTSFVCGAVLLGWSLVTGRQELWTVGLPATLGGQIALMLGLVLQLDRVWRDNRTAAAKLDKVGQQLHELKTTTTLLSTTQGPAANVFYSHLVGGAGPKLLLADLKSQLDLLALKIADEE